jgi:hypothetical protein
LLSDGKECHQNNDEEYVWRDFIHVINLSKNECWERITGVYNTCFYQNVNI